MRHDETFSKAIGQTPDEIYDRWIRPVESQLAASAFRVLRSEQETAEVLQNAMARIWKHHATLTTHANPIAWMLRIVLNSTYDHLRRRKDNSENLQLVSLSPSIVCHDAIVYDESRQRVLDELASLSPQQAEAVLLRLVEGLPYEEVAEALECSLATARVHVNRGREKLRARLRDLDPANEGVER